MFGVGVGMLYTPVLVDRMRLTFPSGLAVANILRALTDPTLLRRSVRQLGGGMAAGLMTGLASAAPAVCWAPSNCRRPPSARGSWSARASASRR